MRSLLCLLCLACAPVLVLCLFVDITSYMHFVRCVKAGGQLGRRRAAAGAVAEVITGLSRTQIVQTRVRRARSRAVARVFRTPETPISLANTHSTPQQSVRTHASALRPLHSRRRRRLQHR